MGGEAAHFWYTFFEFSRGGTRLLIIFSEEFATSPLVTARLNFAKIDAREARMWLVFASFVIFRDLFYNKLGNIFNINPQG